MRSLTWSTSHAVFVPEIDDEHKEIFEALADFREALRGASPAGDAGKLTQRLTGCIVAHFAHEERLMRAARYDSLRWHKRQHDNARKRVGQFIRQMEQGDTRAGEAMAAYLTSWLHDHTRLADRMLGAFLRNRRLCKVTFRAGTRPIDACDWVDSKGRRFQPAAMRKEL